MEAFGITRENFVISSYDFLVNTLFSTIFLQWADNQ
jgi:hypothetical protein